MAVNADSVIVELEARNGRYNADIARSESVFNRSMRNIRGQATATEARVTSAFRGMATAMGVTLGAAGIAAGTRAFLGYVDAAKQIEAQLRLATRETGNFAQAQEDVRRIARETRSGLEEVATLYSTLQRNSRELGLTQAQVAQMTQTVTQTFLISGASAAEAAGGLRQFIQGLQSGTLRGEEFNSVMENAPRLARALADELNVPIGQLRAMAEQGELTGTKVSGAILAASATIQEEFDQLPVTFDQAMTLLNNAATETFSAFDRGGRFSEALINFITGGTDGMEDLADSAEQTGSEIRAAFEGLANAFDPLLQSGMAAFDALGIRSVALRDQIAALLGAFDQVQNLGGYGPRLQNRVRDLDIAIFGGSTLNRATPSNARGRFLGAFDASIRASQIDRSARSLGGGARDGRSVGPQEFQRFINEPGRYDLFGNPIGGAGPPPRVSAGGGSRRRGGGGRGESAEARATRQAREDERFSQELAALQVDLISAQQARTAAAAAVAALEIQEIEATRDRQNAAYQADADQARDRDALAQTRAQQLVEANNAVAAERINAVRLREEERVRQEQLEVAAADLHNAIDLEQAQGQMARTNEERRDSALRLLDYQKELERLELEGIVASRDATEAQKEIARRRLELLDTIYSAEGQNVRDQTLSPRERYMRNLRDVGETINDSLDQVAIDGLERLNDGLVEAIMNAKSLGDVFKQVAKQIIADLLRIAIQQAIVRPLANAIFGGGFGIPGFAAGGSIILGGKPGIDKNVLSLNGRPIARVGRGEALSVAPQGASAAGVAASPGGAPIIQQTIQVDARGAVMNDQFASMILARANQDASRIAAVMGKGVLKAVPARLSQFNSDGA